MKNLVKMFGFIAFVAVIGFSMAACKDDGGDGGSSDPASTKVTWTQDSKDYELVYTELSSSKSTYILSVGTDGYSVGAVTISGTTYSFATDPKVYSSSYTFTMNIDNSTNKVTTTSAQPIKLINSSGTTSDASLPVTNATAKITDNTGGTGTNPFVGYWKDNPVEVSVSSNLTWSATAPGYKGSGSYAYINNSAIIYDSNGSFFGYANIVSGKMEAMTFNGNYSFTK